MSSPRIDFEALHKEQNEQKTAPCLNLKGRNLTKDDLIKLKIFLDDNPQITNIILSDNQLNDEGAKIIAACQHLKHVTADNCQIGSVGAIALLNNSNLLSLSLADNHLIYFYSRSQKVRLVPTALISLTLTNCGIFCLDLIEILEAKKNLEVLILNNNARLYGINLDKGLMLSLSQPKSPILDESLTLIANSKIHTLDLRQTGYLPHDLIALLVSNHLRKFEYSFRLITSPSILSQLDETCKKNEQEIPRYNYKDRPVRNALNACILQNRTRSALSMMILFSAAQTATRTPTGENNPILDSLMPLFPLILELSDEKVTTMNAMLERKQNPETRVRSLLSNTEIAKNTTAIAQPISTLDVDAKTQNEEQEAKEILDNIFSDVIALRGKVKNPSGFRLFSGTEIEYKGEKLKIPSNLAKIFNQKNTSDYKSGQYITTLEKVRKIAQEAAHKPSNNRHPDVQSFYEAFLLTDKAYKMYFELRFRRASRGSV